MSAKIKEAAQEELARVQHVAEEGIRSKAYFYPIKGIYHFLSHSDLQKPLRERLVPTLGLGTAVTVVMFLVAYLPQAAMMAFTSGPLAALTAFLLVLSESSTLTTVLAKTLLVSDALVDTFDATLLTRGEGELVATERKVAHSSAGDVISRMGKLAKRPFERFTPNALVRYVMLLPLNFVPIVGTAAFVILQGRKFGPQAHQRYFQLKGMSKAQKEQFVEDRKGAYASFGIVATLLEMVPIVGILFTFTNTAGAALWAADMEHQGGTGTAPGLREQAKKAE